MESRIYKINATYEERSLGGTNKGVFVGDPIRFNEWSEILYTEDGIAFREMISPIAWETADTSECLAVFNHKEDQLLGTSAAGTLRFMPYSEGVKVEIDKADTTISRDVSEWVKRGEVRGMSFKFTIGQNGNVDSFNKELGIWERTITSFGKIYDVCPVTRPAYPTTKVEGRSIVITAAFQVEVCQEAEEEVESPEIEVPDNTEIFEDSKQEMRSTSEILYNYFLNKHRARK